jgi:hypothetical protein
VESDLDIDMVWDNYNVLTSDIDFQTPIVVQPNAGHFSSYPLAHSAPRYPALPSINYAPYGPNPNDVSGIAIRSASPPIRPGTLGPPAAMTVTPVVTQSLPSLPVTIIGLNTPVLPPSLPPSQASAAAVAAIVDPASGARPRTPTIPPPPPIPSPAHVTRSATGKIQSRQFPQDIVNAGKSLLTSVQSKKQRKDSKKARSISEDSKIQ